MSMIYPMLLLLYITTLRVLFVDGLATPTTVIPHQTGVQSVNTLLDKATIRKIQTEKEQFLRSIHDNTKFNALFLNVPERPDPKPITVSSVNEKLPSNFPPGCLLRLGPNGAPSHDGFMDGDGFINCITIPPSLIRSKESSNDSNNDESVVGTLSSTYVQTRGRKLEEMNPGRKFLGTLGSVPRGLPLLKSVALNAIQFRTLQCQKDTCNTALAVHGNRLLALMEQCPPSEIQVSRDGRVHTISDSCRLGDAIPWSPITGGSLSAHGRTCPITKERVHVSYDGNAKPYVRVDVFDTQFQLKRSIPINVPCPTMVHDCAITNQYVVILDFPLTLRSSRFLKDQFPVEYEPEYGARIGLLDRKNAIDDTGIVWFDCEPGIILHTVNAYDNELTNTVIVQVLRSEPDGTKGYLEEFTASYLYEYELDLTTGKVVSERYLNPYEPVEFPIINPNYIGQQSNNAVYCSSVRSIGGPLLHHKQPVTGITISGVTKFTLKDTSSNRKGDVVGTFTFPLPWMVVSEPTVVPKTDGDGEYVLLIATKVPSTTSDDGTTTSSSSAMKSRLVVLDGGNLNNGPIWECDLPHHVHYGLHSLYLDWNLMV